MGARIRRASEEGGVGWATLIDQPLQLADQVEWEDVRGLDREAITKVRVNQHFFREMILANYRQRCAVCEVPFRAILVASHIVPWSLDKSQRMNPSNGICLCSLHDKLGWVGYFKAPHPRPSPRKRGEGRVSFVVSSRSTCATMFTATLAWQP